MAQDKGHEEPDNTDTTPDGPPEDLPEFLRTEPIPITAAPEDEPTHDPETVGDPESADEEVAKATEVPESVDEPGPVDEEVTEVTEDPATAREQTEVFERVSARDRVGGAADPPAGGATPAAETTDFETHQPQMMEGPQTPVESDEVKKSKGKKAVIVVAASVLVLALGYVGAAWFFGDRVPADTTVAGVDISGLSRGEAVSHLETELDDVMTSEIALTLGDAESAIDPEAAGLAVDIDGTVDELVGFSLHPSSVFGHLFGKGAHDPIIHTDTSDLRQALTSIAEDLNVAPVEGEIAIVEGEVETVDPEDGVSIDVDAAIPLIADEWLQGSRPLVLPSEVVPPAMDADKIARAQESVIDPLFSGDVPLSINDKEAEIPNEKVVDAASLHLDGTTYEVRLDPEVIAEAVRELLPELGESPKDARFEFKEGKPRIVPSVTGAGINHEELAEVVAEAAVRTGEARAASIELETTEPEFTTEDAEKLGVKERVSHFSTPVPYDPVRTKNLVNGAKKLNGMLIKPGETFSLIEAFGPIDAAHGFVESGVVVNGFEDTAMGGGLSQVSTTMFNAAFEAGMEDVTHTPHSRHFQRYPEGREATLFLPNLDLKWRNNTPHGVLIQAWIDDDTNVALWSTKYWDTKITTGPRTNITPPKTVYNTSSRCTPESGGSSGFSVSVQRIVSKDGKRNDEYSRSYTHTYQPWNHVICGEKPKSED